MGSFWAIAHPSSVSRTWIALAGRSLVFVGFFNQRGLQTAHVEAGAHRTVLG